MDYTIKEVFMTDFIDLLKDNAVLELKLDKGTFNAGCKRLERQ